MDAKRRTQSFFSTDGFPSIRYAEGDSCVMPRLHALLAYLPANIVAQNHVGVVGSEVSAVAGESGSIGKVTEPSENRVG